MLCLTGLPLIFRDDINDLIFEDIYAAEIVSAPAAVNLDRIVDAGRRMYPGWYVRTLFWDDGNSDIIKISVVPSPEATSAIVHRLAFDARSGQFLGEAKLRRGVMSFILGLHRDMLFGLAGSLFLGLMGLTFAVAVISGVVIYAPFMRKLDFGAVRKGGSPRLKWLDLHNLLGIVTATWVLVVGVTGVMNTVAIPLFGIWRAETLRTLLAPHTGQVPIARFSSVDDAVKVARAALPQAEVESVVFPGARFGSPHHYLIWTKGTTPLTARLSTPVLVDAESGALTRAQGLPWYLRLIEVARPLHFGDYGGMPLKIVWALLDIMTIVVLGSGLYLWGARRALSGGGRPSKQADLAAFRRPPA